jgi:hypothetical protein
MGLIIESTSSVVEWSYRVDLRYSVKTTNANSNFAPSKFALAA